MFSYLYFNSYVAREVSVTVGSMLQVCCEPEHAERVRGQRSSSCVAEGRLSTHRIPALCRPCNVTLLLHDGHATFNHQ